ncbi:hypothetical protein DFH06DRAFT_1160268 [Mycena polygramma]|nr:hypothetical protein DFH06DRAFT_1160268 [Mycena polygramma]
MWFKIPFVVETSPLQRRRRFNSANISRGTFDLVYRAPNAVSAPTSARKGRNTRTPIPINGELRTQGNIFVRSTFWHCVQTPSLTPVYTPPMFCMVWFKFLETLTISPPQRLSAAIPASWHTSECAPLRISCSPALDPLFLSSGHCSEFPGTIKPVRHTASSTSTTTTVLAHRSTKETGLSFGPLQVITTFL